MKQSKTETVSTSPQFWVSIGSAVLQVLQGVEEKRSRLSEEFGRGHLVLDRVA
jgi:hypothetical protein